MVRDRFLPTTLTLTAWAATTSIAWGQSITPAPDGTGTLVQTNNGTYQITGGSFSGDGANLFHSFQAFGLSAGEAAWFISQPQVQNILGRVVGGNPSHIDGLIGVSGSNANLYLMNPAGLVFGPNASLNVPADFVATTATGIGLGDGQWFEAMGSLDYSALVGDPNQFAFDLVHGSAQGGAIVNGGDLAVETGQHLGLVAETVVNTGSLTASAGQVTIAAVPHSSLVNISQPGQLLSLEVEAPRDPQGALASFNPLDLPALLTGAGEAGLADLGLTTDAHTITLTATGTAIPLATQTSIVTGNIDVSGGQGGQIAVLGQNVGLVGATLDASGVEDGGTIRVGGEYHGQGGLPNATYTVVDTTSTLNANAGLEGDGGRVIVWADQSTDFGGQVFAEGGLFGGDGGFIEVSGKEGLVFTGTASTQATFGEVGQLLLDPRNITITSGSVGTLPSGLSDHFWARAEDSGDQTIGVADLRSLLSTNDLKLEANQNITWSAGAQLDTSGFAAGRTLTLQANKDIIFQEATPILAGGDALNLTLIANRNASQVRAQDPSTSQIHTNGGAFTIQGRHQIHLGQITTAGGAIDITNSRTTQLGNIATAGGAVDITVTGKNDLTTGTINSGAGNIDIDSRNSVTVGAISTTSGNVSLNSSVGRTETDVGVHAQTITTDTGSVTLSSLNNLNVGEIQTNGGAVNINNAAAREVPFAINAQDITTNGGALTVNTLSNTQLGNINTAGGAVDIDLLTKRDLTTGTINSGAGNIDIIGRNSVTVGAISTTSGNVSLNSSVGRAETDVGVHAQTITTETGAVTLSSHNNLNVSTIQTNGGAVNLNNAAGRGDPFAITAQDITTNGGAVTVDTRSTTQLGNINTAGGAVDIDLLANRTITTGAIDSGAGNIDIIGRNSVTVGAISTTSGSVSLNSSVGRAETDVGVHAQTITTGTGAVTLSSHNNLNVNTIQTSGGAVNLNNAAGRGDPFKIQSQDITTQGGALTVNTFTTTQLGNVDTAGGAVDITVLNNRALTTGTINAAAGNIAIKGRNNLNLGDLTTTSGNITLTSDAYRDATIGLTAQNITTQGGGVTITTPNTTTVGDITTQGGGIDLDILNNRLLQGGRLDSSAATGNGGAIAIDSRGAVSLTSINAQGNRVSGQGGAIDITTKRDFRVTGTFTAHDGLTASISNVGGVGQTPANLVIDYATRNRNPRFDLADSFATSGTVGAITNGSQNLQPTQFFPSRDLGTLNIIGRVDTSPDIDLANPPSDELPVDSPISPAPTEDMAIQPSLEPTEPSVELADLDIAALNPATDSSDSSSDAGSFSGSSGRGNSQSAAAAFSHAEQSFGSAFNAYFASGGGDAGPSSGAGGSVGSSAAGVGGASPAGAGGSGGSSSAGGSAAGASSTANSSSGNGGSGAASGSGAAAASIAGNGAGGTGTGSTGTTGSTNGTGGPAGASGRTSGTSASGGNAAGSGARGNSSGAAGEGSSSDSATNASSDSSSDAGSDGMTANDSSSDSDSDSNSGGSGSGNAGGAGLSVADAQASLRDIEAATGVSPALLYGIFAPPLGMSNEPQPTDQLFLILVPPNGDPIMQAVPANRQMVMRQARAFRRRVTNAQRQDYLPPAQQLYEWLIAPLQTEIATAGIEHLTFLLDSGLRSLPLAALHNGEEFLVEQYSLSLMPSMSLSDLSYRPITHMDLLAMGTSTFEEHEPLPAAGVEVELLTQELWDGTSLQDEDFSAEQLKSSRSHTPYGMLHLATHSNFQAGTPQDSYIQMGNERLGLDELRQLGLHSPAIELMVLSACQTALGDTEAELGFAGLAVLAGVKTAVGSLWQVNDLGTLGFMSGFYSQLREAPIKATALQQAQLSFLHNQVQVDAGALQVGDRTVSLPPELQTVEGLDLTHPYYWSAFTMIGTPW